MEGGRKEGQGMIFSGSLLRGGKRASDEAPASRTSENFKRKFANEGDSPPQRGGFCFW